MTDEDDPFADSDPEPAPVIPPVEDHFEMVQEGVLSTDDISCANCVHSDVCVFREKFSGMLRERDRAPLEGDDLAAICEAFEHEDAEDGPTVLQPQ